jgi:Glycosyl transferase family 2
MSLIRKLIRYPIIVCKCWWRGGLQAVADDLRASLRDHLGIPQLEERARLIENEMLPALSTWMVSCWIEHATLERTPLVSVIVPTHDRATLLPRAVESVCAQVYKHWEIVLTDDGSTDSTPAVVERLRKRLGDDRFKAERVIPSGVCAARNHALDRARGEFIVYLDDDNVMHPMWLKAVVWAFLQRPEVDVIYGGLIIDDMKRMNGRDSGDLPRYYLHPFDRQRLAHDNLADIGQIAHRRGLLEARFDENLGGLGDWDLLTRLTREKEPMVIPALACLYSTAAQDRLSTHPSFQDEKVQVRQRSR